MCHVYNEKWKTTNDEKNITNKSRKKQNIQGTGSLQILGNIAMRYNQTSGHRENIKKKNIPGELELSLKLNYFAEISSKR